MTAGSEPLAMAAEPVAIRPPSVALDYFELMKPRVMSLVVFTALAGLLLAPGQLHPVLGFTALLCIAVGAGAAVDRPAGDSYATCGLYGHGAEAAHRGIGNRNRRIGYARNLAARVCRENRHAGRAAVSPGSADGRNRELIARQ